MADQQFPGGIQPHAARQALKNRGAQFRLHILDAAIERGGGQVELFRRAPDGPGPGDLIDVAQKPQMAHGGA